MDNFMKTFDAFVDRILALFIVFGIIIAFILIVSLLVNTVVDIIENADYELVFPENCLDWKYVNKDYWCHISDDGQSRWISVEPKRVKLDGQR